MPPQNILVVVVDGLRASALGAYGNTTSPTPALDQFAAQSFVLDWCYAPSPTLADIYRALWQSGPDSLPQVLRAAKCSTTLITDAAEVASFAGAADFDEIISLTPASTQRAESAAETELARVFMTATEALADSANDSSRMIWLHAQGMYGPWDAPLELQQSLLDEGDPPPVEDATPPDFAVDTTSDPDAAFRFACAYAAQVMVLDECWEHLQAVVRATGRDWLVPLIGARGFPLGEHGRIGGVDPRLYGEQLHVPWLINFPDGLGRVSRSGQLVSHFDLLPTLAEWLGLTSTNIAQPNGQSVFTLAKGDPRDWRDSLLAASASTACAIRTADWCLRCDAPADNGAAPASADQCELFVRPDDRWEANDVAKLCPDVVEELAQILSNSPT